MWSNATSNEHLLDRIGTCVMEGVAHLRQVKGVGCAFWSWGTPWYRVWRSSLVRLCLGPRQLGSPNSAVCGQPEGVRPPW